MSKLFQALLTGVFFTFILDGFLFIGILVHYINAYDIPVYYNILFADHQCWLLFGLLSLILGFVSIYLNNTKIKILILSIFFVLTALSLIPTIGNTLGQAMLMKKAQTLKDNRYTYYGDIYYEGRDFYYFYDDELQKFITLKKKDIIK